MIVDRQFYPNTMKKCAGGRWVHFGSLWISLFNQIHLACKPMGYLGHSAVGPK